jgi:hypothetical protein
MFEKGRIVTPPLKLVSAKQKGPMVQLHYELKND